MSTVEKTRKISRKFPVTRCTDIAILIFLAVFPFFAREFRVEMMGSYICYAIFALSLDLLWGYTGLLSLGHAVLFGMGGYMIGLSYQIQNGVPAFMQREGITELPWFYAPLKDPIVAAIIGIVLPAAFAFLIGKFVFSSKIKGVFFTIITLALAQIFKDFIINLQKYTNGFNGLQSIQRFALHKNSPLTKVQYYYVILAVGTAVFLFCMWLTNSRIGKVCTSVRENESRLGFLGYNTSAYKILIFTVSGALAGLAGVMYAPCTSTITTEDIGVAASTMAVIRVAVGGRGNLTGAVVGTLLVSWAQSLLSEYFSGYWQLIIGVLLLAVIYFIPDGIMGRIIKLTRRGADDAKSGKELKNRKVTGNVYSLQRR